MPRRASARLGRDRALLLLGEEGLPDLGGEADQEGPKRDGEEDHEHRHLGHQRVALGQGQATQDQVELPPGDQVKGGVKPPLPAQARPGPAQVVEGELEEKPQKGQARAHGGEAPQEARGLGPHHQEEEGHPQVPHRPEEALQPLPEAQGGGDHPGEEGPHAFRGPQGVKEEGGAGGEGGTQEEDQLIGEALHEAHQVGSQEAGEGQVGQGQKHPGQNPSRPMPAQKGEKKGDDQVLQHQDPQDHLAFRVGGPAQVNDQLDDDGAGACVNDAGEERGPPGVQPGKKAQEKAQREG